LGCTRRTGKAENKAAAVSREKGLPIVNQQGGSGDQALIAFAACQACVRAIAPIIK
jgi:hypothetical protein